MNLTIVIPFYNGHVYIDRLVNSIPENIPVVIVDDRSTEPLQSSKFGNNVLVARMPEKGYFSGACNLGIKLAKKADVLILNQDVELEGTQWLDLIADNRDQYALIGERAGTNPAWIHSYVHGTFMFMRRDAIDTVGLFNAEIYPLWGSTCEWQLRACRLGYQVLNLTDIPGFTHYRKGNFGESIKSLLRRKTTLEQELFIRTPPAVSIIVSLRNYGRYLPDLFGSLLGGTTSLGFFEPQTLQSFEVIMVDDASTDDSVEIAKSFVDPLKGIHLITHDIQRGTAAANNTGISSSHAKCITIMCADDMRESWSLEALYRAQTRNDHSLIYDSIMPFANGARQPDIPIGVSEYDFERLLYKNHVHAGIMFPKSAWRKAGGYPEKFGDGREDWAFNIALGIQGYCGVFLQSKGYLYRRESQNRTLSNTTPSHHQQFLLKLQTTFPRIYQGYRPMGCCGGRSARARQVSRKNTRSKKIMNAIVPGSEGAMLVEYVGGNYGNQTVTGCFTKTRYVVNKTSRLQIYIDVRDARSDTLKHPGILERKENDALAFREIKEEKHVTPVVVEEVATPTAKEVDISESIPENYHLSSLSVSEIKKLKFTSDDDITNALDQEKAGKNRISVTRYLKGLLNA